MALLDTTALIDLARPPEFPAHQRVRVCMRRLLGAGETLFTSRINEAEFRVGPEMSDRRQEELQRVQRVLEGVIILEFDADAARYYAIIKAATLKRGQPIGDCDAMIAAVAMVNGQSLLTRNPRHFTNIGSLLVQPY